jgi:hypothetical protein
MSTPKSRSSTAVELPAEFARLLGVRRSMTLRRIMRQTALPPEVLLDLALEMLDLASRKLAPAPIQRTAVGLGAARWRNVSPEDRSDALRRAAQARWDKHRQKVRDEESGEET